MTQNAHGFALLDQIDHGGRIGAEFTQGDGVHFVQIQNYLYILPHGVWPAGRIVKAYLAHRIAGRTPHVEMPA
jgi:hypothetical protein